jgi:hypothetical protein
MFICHISFKSMRYFCFGFCRNQTFCVHSIVFEFFCVFFCGGGGTWTKRLYCRGRKGIEDWSAFELDGSRSSPPESIELFENLAFSPCRMIQGLPTLSPVSESSPFLRLAVCRRLSLLRGEGRRGVES